MLAQLSLVVYEGIKLMQKVCRVVMRDLRDLSDAANISAATHHILLAVLIISYSAVHV